MSPDLPLPENLDAERFLLGACLSQPEELLTITSRLTPDDFSLEKHRRIYLRILDLQDAKSPIDRVTVAQKLINLGQLQSVGGLTYLTSLDDGMPRLYNVQSYIDIVREKSLRRRAILTLQAGIDQALRDEEMPAISLLADVEDRIGRLASTVIATDLERPSDIVANYPGGMNAFFNPSVRRATGLSTGFIGFDNKTGGLREGELIILAGRPAMGKTALALNIGHHVACHPKQPKAVAVFSLEMSKESLVTRLVCSAGRVDQQRFRAGYLNDAERRHILQAYHQISEAPIYIDDTAGINLLDVHAKCRRLAQDADLGLVIVDYLQLMQGRSRGGANRVQEISDLSRGFKLLAKELKVPFLVLSQLSRAPETRPGDHRPMLSDLRESGCLAGDTLVTDAESGRRIPIRDVRAGMKVWALNEHTLRLEPMPVLAFIPTGTKRIFTLTTQLGRKIRATANHRFLSFGGWKELGQLKKGERIALPRLIPSGSKTEPTMDLDRVRLLAHLIGNGCTLPGHAIQYTTADPELASLVCELAKRCFGDEVFPRSKAERTWIQTFLSSTKRHTHGQYGAIRLWLESLGVFGLRSHEKFVPDQVFTQPNSTIAEFLAHLWTSDGCIHLRQDSGYPTVYYGSSSPRLARDVQVLLLRLGVNARLSRSNQMAKGRAMYYVEVSGRDELLTFCRVVGPVGSKRQQFIEQIQAQVSQAQANTNRDVIPKDAWTVHAIPAMRSAGITGRELAAELGMSYCGHTLYKSNLGRARAARVAAAVQSEVLRRLAESDVYWDQVASIEYAGAEPVFDLTVDKHHNFLADEIVVHNSIEQDADMVAFVFREEVYRPDKESLKGLAELILAKQRNGPIGRIKLAYLNRYTKFENLAAQTGEEEDENVSPFEGGNNSAASPDEGHIDPYLDLGGLQ